MYSDKSALIAELAELYEFSLNIGTSLNASKNATAFFTSFAQRKNLKYISVWQRQEDVLHLKESFPKVHGSDEKIGHDSPLCKHFTILEEGKVHRIDEQNMCFSGFDAQSVWLYYSKDIYILFLQNELDPDFSNREKSQFATLFKKFALSMKACFSHKASLDEVIKRNKAEQKLFERESLYRFGANSLREGIVVTDLENRITYVNNAMCKITGFPRDEMIGLIGYELFKPVGFTNEIMSEVLEHTIKDQTKTYEVEQIKKDGTQYWVRITVSAFKNSQGKSETIIASMVDITEALNYQRTIEKSQKDLQELIDKMYDGLVLLDSEGVIQEANNSAIDLFEINRKNLGKINLEELVHPDKKASIHEYKKRLIMEGNLSTFESKILTPLGNTKYVEVSSSAIWENDTFVGSRDIVRDITKRKEVEAQKESLLAELELVNQELRDFAYIISHDLKAPLRSIGSLSDWLIQDYTEVIDSEGKELLQLLKARIGRMHGLIEGVLEFSKVGRLQNEKEEVDINIVVAETIDLLDPPSNFKVKVDKNLPTVSYDRVRLQQVFQNLLDNAIKFMDKPNGLLEVLFKEDDSFYYFSIKDNGPGIEGAYFQKIFQIFQTLRSKDDYESTGIGLGIVKRIVELNGGSISVSSEVEVGSTFSFTILKNE